MLYEMLKAKKIGDSGGGGFSQIAKLSTTAENISESDMYIAESTDYFYIFGTATAGSTSSADFIIPDSFDKSKIGNFYSYSGCKRKIGQSSSGSAYNCAFTFTSPNVISFSPTSGAGSYIGLFYKST